MLILHHLHKREIDVIFNVSISVLMKWLYTYNEYILKREKRNTQCGGFVQVGGNLLWPGISGDVMIYGNNRRDHFISGISWKSGLYGFCM